MFLHRSLERKKTPLHLRCSEENELIHVSMIMERTDENNHHQKCVFICNQLLALVSQYSLFSLIRLSAVCIHLFIDADDEITLKYVLTNRFSFDE